MYTTKCDSTIDLIWECRNGEIAGYPLFKVVKNQNCEVKC